MNKKKIWIFLDCEGPCVLNDNAQESTVALAVQCGLGEEVGVNFFQRLSVIDDIWGDFHKIPKDPTYSSGHTLKVILPFFKAMGATEKWLYDFARESLRMVPYIKETINQLAELYNVWMISTSYEWFIRAFCDWLGFDFEKAECTKVSDLDGVAISIPQSALLLDFMKETVEMPVIEYNHETGDVIPEHQQYYDRVTKFIWETVYNMPVGKFLRSVRPVGQTQKREAMEAICKQFGITKEKVMYVGDSQTDVQCAEWLRGEGLSMMFNGKGRVCALSDIMFIGADARAIDEIAYNFSRAGRQGTINFSGYQDPDIEAEIGEGGLLAAVTPENWKALEKKSVAFRKQFRGVHIGELT